MQLRSWKIIRRAPPRPVCNPLEADVKPLQTLHQAELIAEQGGNDERYPDSDRLAGSSAAYPVLESGELLSSRLRQDMQGRAQDGELEEKAIAEESRSPANHGIGERGRRGAGNSKVRDLQNGSDFGGFVIR